MTHRIIYYYQTFTGLDNIIRLKQCPVTHIHVASIHFGMNQYKPYIHLNNYPPDSSIFNHVWNETKLLSERGVSIRLMVGGAGRAFNVLFSNFTEYYSLLKDTINKRPWISGIDLDVEEGVDIYNIVMLVNRIRADFGEEFAISFAPIGYALEVDITGLGGFCYKELDKLIGDKIEYYNGQFYANFTTDSYSQAICNGYNPSKVVLGMVTGQFDSTNFNKCLDTIIELCNKYKNFGGVFIWEYKDAPPSRNPADWAILINAVMKNKYNIH